MFQFTGLPFQPYVFRLEHARITTHGFPHSETPGSKVGQHLIRDYRSRPRPSSAPGAKASTVRSCSLDHEEHRVCRYGVFKVRASELAEMPASAGLSKLNSVERRGRRSFQASPNLGRRRSTITNRATYRSKSSGFPRKEVIQPQLPLRLPCYDFTPITNPTFDGSLPCGLGHRLRVLPASVV